MDQSENQNKKTKGLFPGTVLGLVVAACGGIFLFGEGGALFGNRVEKLEIEVKELKSRVLQLEEGVETLRQSVHHINGKEGLTERLRLVK